MQDLPLIFFFYQHFIDIDKIILSETNVWRL